MKRFIPLMLLFHFISLAPLALADELKDNSLHLDNTRLEKGEETKFGYQSELIKALFSESDYQKIQEAKEGKIKQLAQEKGQLFSATQTKKDKYSSEQLFQPTSQQVAKQDPNLIGVEEKEDFLPTISYTVAILLLVSLAGFVSYRISKEEERED